MIDIKKMMNTSNLGLDYGNIDTYSKVDGLSLQNLYFVNNEKFPNCYMFTRTKSPDSMFDTKSIFNILNEKYSDEIKYIKYLNYNLDEQEEDAGYAIWLTSLNIYIRLETSISETYILYGNDDEESLSGIIDILREYYVTPEREKNNLFLVAQDNTGYKLNKWHIKEVTDFDINKQYNDDIVDIDYTIDDFITQENKSGLLILHGEKGTGKSTYIRHLITKYESKKFVFIPSNLIGLLGEPSFGNFLLSLSNTIIILEDCENVIRSRKSGMSAGNAVSLLLNMSDGLMSDDLGIKFICTFNENISNIDSALLRKGRLVAKYEFKQLNEDKTKALLAEVIENKISELTNKADTCEDINKKERILANIQKLTEIPEYTGRGLTLADIYNIDEESFQKEEKKIGFNG